MHSDSIKGELAKRIGPFVPVFTADNDLTRDLNDCRKSIIYPSVQILN